MTILGNDCIRELILKVYEEKEHELAKLNQQEIQYFVDNYYRIPCAEIFFSSSYKDYLENLKRRINDTNIDYVDEYNKLVNVLFFSAGNDFMFKKKLEATNYVAKPIFPLVYPIIERTILGKYDDSSFDRKASYKRAFNDINKTVDAYFFASFLMYYLYCNDFVPQENLGVIFGDNLIKAREALRKSGIKIGDFLKYLIDFKCSHMIDVFSRIDNKMISSLYINKTQALGASEKEKVDNFYLADLDICYFMYHSYSNFLRGVTEKEHFEKKIKNSRK